MARIIRCITITAAGTILILLCNCNHEQPLVGTSTSTSIVATVLWKSQSDIIYPDSVDTIRITLSSPSLHNDRISSFPFDAEYGSFPDIPIGIELTITIEGLSHGGTVLYRGSITVSETSGPFMEVTIEAYSVTPIAPSNVHIDVLSYKSVRIEWTDNSNNEKGFIIERADKQETKFITIAATAANVTLYIDTTLSALTEFHYRIRVWNDQSEDEGDSTFTTSTSTKVTTKSTDENSSPYFISTPAQLEDTVNAGSEYCKTISYADDDENDSIWLINISSKLTLQNDTLLWKTEFADTGTHHFSCEVRDREGEKSEIQWDVVVIEQLAHVVEKPNAPTGITNGITNTVYQFKVTSDKCSKGHDLSYRFDWRNGDTTNWTSSDSATHSWEKEGTFSVKVQARCSDDTTIISEWSDPLKVTIASHEVSSPQAPKGDTLGVLNGTYHFSTGESTCDQEHAIQYRFDWGDGTSSAWIDTTSAFHTWQQPNTYWLKAQARCKQDTTIISEWSDSIAIRIVAISTFHVKADAKGNNDGSSWEHAYVDLSQALEVANKGTRIWVAAGTYKPSVLHNGTGPRYKSFALKSGVEVYGGFKGTEISFDERNSKDNVTILSGDIGVEGDSSDNCYHVIYNDDQVDTTAILDGFTVTGGYAIDNDIQHDGGGIYNWGSPKIINCSFKRNYAVNAGAIKNEGSSAIIYNCIFENNQAQTECGGAIKNLNASPFIYGCTFVNNFAGDFGGAIDNVWGSPIIVNCTFNTNISELEGGAISSAGLPIIVNCTFVKNSSQTYGGATNADGIFINCILWNNTAILGENEAAGSGIYSFCIIDSGHPPGTDLIEEDPLLSNLSDNGGNVQTFGLESGSPAIDGGAIFYRDDAGENQGTIYYENPDVEGTFRKLPDCSYYEPSGSYTLLTPQFDARGVARPQEGGIDIGAYERE